MDVHYTWIGPYKEDALDRPSAMKQALGNTASVYFWCLGAGVERFTARAGRLGTGITVRSIDGFLQTTLGRDPGFGGQVYDFMYRWWYWYGRTEDEVAEGVHRILRRALANAQNRHIPEETKKREFVNAKNIWNYYLLYTWGGYVMDTNVEALRRNVRFPALGRLKCPRVGNIRNGFFVSTYACGQRPYEDWIFATNVNRDIGNINLDSRAALRLNRGDYMGGDTPAVDVWFLACERYHADALRALRHHIFLMDCVYRKYQELVFVERNEPEEGNLYNYHMACADAVVEALLTGMLVGANRRPVLEIDWARRTWSTTSNENTKTIDDLQVRKTLNRSHVIRI